ncbi:hypothetical protein F5B17DRAFT_435086 [Nemania serpens]|nr:hypothetical protein F5B17DRAFT_435086 [Nemania serpens]
MPFLSSPTVPSSSRPSAPTSGSEPDTHSSPPEQSQTGGSSSSPTGAGVNTGAGTTREKTEAEIEADRLYEEAMEEEYAKREGGRKLTASNKFVNLIILTPTFTPLSIIAASDQGGRHPGLDDETGVT